MDINTAERWWATHFVVDWDDCEKLHAAEPEKVLRLHVIEHNGRLDSYMALILIFSQAIQKPDEPRSRNIYAVITTPWGLIRSHAIPRHMAALFSLLGCGFLSHVLVGASLRFTKDHAPFLSYPKQAQDYVSHYFVEESAVRSYSFPLLFFELAEKREWLVLDTLLVMGPLTSFAWFYQSFREVGFEKNYIIGGDWGHVGHLQTAGYNFASDPAAVPFVFNRLNTHNAALTWIPQSSCLAVAKTSLIRALDEISPSDLRNFLIENIQKAPFWCVDQTHLVAVFGLLYPENIKASETVSIRASVTGKITRHNRRPSSTLWNVINAVETTQLARTLANAVSLFEHCTFPEIRTQDPGRSREFLVEM